MRGSGTWKNRIGRFVLALLLVLGAAGLRILTHAWLGSRVIFLFFWPAILAAAWFGGVSAGVWALVFSTIGGILIFERGGNLMAISQEDWISLGLFLLVASPVIFAVEAARRARAAAEESKATLDQALSAGGMGYWIWDFPSGKVSWSRNLEEIHRLPPGSFAPDIEGFLAPIHPDDRARVREAIERAVSSHGDYDVDFRVGPAGGALQWISGRGHVVSRDGRPVRMVSLRRNITERMAAEQAQRHLAAIVSSSADAIVSKDLEGRILSWNAAAERLFGYREHEVLGRSIEILHPEGSEDFRTILERIAKGEKVEHYETVRRRKDGSLIDVALTVSPILDESGRVIGASKTLRDLTSQREAERERERTRQLFLATLGHDLRNPLNTIAASLYYLQRHAPKSLGHVVERMSGSAGRMARMIAQLLDFTRARLGQGIPLNPQPCDLREVCASVVGEIDAEHPNRLLLQADGEFTGQWDSDRLAQMFSNLFANAVDHGSPADPVKVRLCREDGVVRVQVSNRGEPIPESLQATIFEPFRRGTRERAGQSRGLGLGLYITREIVRSHGGTIDLRSGPEETVFTVKLPVAQPRSEAGPSAHPSRGRT